MFGDSGPGIAVVIFGVTIAASLYGLYRSPQFIERCLFRPYFFLRKQRYETIVTSGFVHGDFGHLLLNMVTFYFFAFPLESRIGPARFALLYLLGLIVSDLGTYFKHRNDPDYASLGASGAISAVLFAAIVYYPEMKLFIIPIPVPIPAPLFAVGYVAYSWWSARQARGRINHDAHLVGALFGVVFVMLTDPQAWAGMLRTLFG
ncbi:MAG: rhomboid family intramembrane serine protease [Lysobacterales bacterium]|nr:MAG: rhomboid family intramembrane serine protease [Xanthomonadales bacterium]